MLDSRTTENIEKISLLVYRMNRAIPSGYWITWSFPTNWSPKIKVNDYFCLWVGKNEDQLVRNIENQGETPKAKLFFFGPVGLLEKRPDLIEPARVVDFLAEG